ncbi:MULTISPECIES: sugar porter family MFS transporter [Brevibacterium]|uniref:Major facilitator superfamily sugar transporter n=4 Tax=Brevibacterium TaxID=1696 RepID=K9AG96_9MICO|nr:sugar porter family MFS transporter [Brevibacterium casei]NJE67455.1 sugar porter family MFS transporter [Brevibacterium sp. LS14]SII00132.1 MFS transporter, sugar porter family [Mycobacteroides abscessus subsp. abscessus]EKU45146.1 major facilitator superfamily sugar transporter [Brevibacterium casei S18]KZE14600.1 MFS transporter [Brevibacterium casei]MBE4694203.1 sugar porter family MFS transporter [Brevibacterium casei]
MSGQQKSLVDLPPDTKGPHTSRLGIIAVVATFGGLLFGYDTGVVNGALEPLTQDFGLTPRTEGIVVSFLTIGAAFGAVIGGRLSDAFGRRSNILLLATFFIVGTLACALAPNWQFLAGARFFLGLAVGAASTTVPVYLAELAPFERRGSLVTRNEVMIVVGQFAAFVINAIIFNIWGEHEGVWRYMLAVAVLPAIALLIGMLFLPESPRWLISKHRDDQAFEVLKQVRSTERAEAEMKEVELLAEEEEKSKTGGLSDLASKWVLRLVIIGVGLGIAQQLTGINSVMYYGTQLLTDAGFSADAAIIANTFNGLFSVLGVTVGIMLINKLPRRVMLLGGFTLTSTFHLLIGLSAVFLPDGQFKAYAILVFVVLFVFSMQGTLGPLVWLMLAEIFPLKIRSFAMGICVFALWMANAAVAQFFPSVVAGMGIANTFFMFAGLGVLALIFIYFMVPETRNKTLEDLEEEFRTKYGR